MYGLQQLEKQQIGLRLPKYLVEEIDELTKEYSLNRSEIITESIKAFLSEQKSRELYYNFDKSCKELKVVLNKEEDELGTLEDLISEIND